MKLGSLILFALVAGCGVRSPPSAYQHLRDQLFAVLPLSIINNNLYPCFRTVNGKPGRLRDEECYRFAEPERMSGVVYLYFDRAGQFYPGLKQEPNDEASSEVWVNLDPSIITDEMLDGCEHCNLYLEFVGRRTLVSGRYGHMGACEHLVVIDQVLIIKVIDDVDF